MARPTPTARARCRLVLLLPMFWAGAANAAEPPVDYNRDVRPILSNRCFRCHGPDEAQRKAKLRLDDPKAPLGDRDGAGPVLVPGKPDESELIARVVSADAEEVMPPAKSGGRLTEREVAVLRSWVAQGAKYARHWAFEKPVRPEPPAVADATWPRNAIDRFILARLEMEGLKPSSEADRHTIARRVALDLTGLPPDPAELERFLADRSPDAYERYVDRLLESPAYGEHWARLWLDLARYADSAGYADDPARTIWAYRDWVIRAVESNTPFDRFTIEQLAGDLLPDPKPDQLVATAFHRNTMTNSEGGTDDEEFRNVAVVDRVNTTTTVWMGLSFACAQCHNHKYDPITQKDYFRLFAFLNETEDADRNDEAPVLPIESSDQRERRESLRSEIARLESKLVTPTPELIAEQAKFEATVPAELPLEPLRPTLARTGASDLRRSDDGSVTPIPDGPASLEFTAAAPRKLTALAVEVVGADSAKAPGITRVTLRTRPGADAVPRGRFVRIELPGKDRLLSLAEVEVFSGAENIARKGSASQPSTAFDGAAARAIDGNTDGIYFRSNSVTHTAPGNDPWWEVDLKSVAPIDRIAVWNRADAGVEDRLADFRVIVLDESRKSVWETVVAPAPKPSVELRPDGSRPVRLVVATADAERPGFEAARVLGDDKPGWSPAGPADAPHRLIVVPAEPIDLPAGGALSITVEPLKQAEVGPIGRLKIAATDHAAAADYARVPLALRSALALPAEKRSPADREALTKHFLGVAPSLAADRIRLAAAKTELGSLKPTTTVPILRELAADKRRVTRVQHRGNFQDLGDVVTAGVPELFPPLPAGAPVDRLALARWIVSPDNPLTARVAVNRYWDQIFGVGLVRTGEEFGSQGELPSHPELLDWLATEFVREGWDVKRLLRLYVTSAAYRQSSKDSPALVERDPDNRLLARGPRFRLSAEAVRDQALFVSGLLSPKRFGPPVNPPRPATGLSAAFGSAIDRPPSTGADRYRRALYTEWRRSNPYPSMTTFDAPNRDVCAVKRNRTNTPLQALVTLNDPVYVEAAQALARRMIAGASTSEDRARLGIRLCLARPAEEREVARLVALYEAAKPRYAADVDKAKAMATDPLGPLPAGVDAADAAAWTVVANVMLNLDEMFLKR